MRNNLTNLLILSAKSYPNKILLTVTKFVFFITCLCLIQLTFKETSITELSAFTFLEIIFLFAVVSGRNSSFFEDKKSGFLNEIRLNNLTIKYLISEFIICVFWNIILLVTALCAFSLLFEKLIFFSALFTLLLITPAIQSLMLISEAFALEIENNIIAIIFTMLFFFPLAIFAALSIQNSSINLILIGINLIFIPSSVYLTKKIIEL